MIVMNREVDGELCRRKSKSEGREEWEEEEKEQREEGEGRKEKIMSQEGASGEKSNYLLPSVRAAVFNIFDFPRVSVCRLPDRNHTFN